VHTRPRNSSCWRQRRSVRCQFAWWCHVERSREVDGACEKGELALYRELLECLGVVQAAVVAALRAPADLRQVRRRTKCGHNGGLHYARALERTAVGIRTLQLLQVQGMMCDRRLTRPCAAATAGLQGQRETGEFPQQKTSPEQRSHRSRQVFRSSCLLHDSTAKDTQPSYTVDVDEKELFKVPPTVLYCFPSKKPPRNSVVKTNETLAATCVYYTIVRQKIHNPRTPWTRWKPGGPLYESGRKRTF